MEAAKASLFSSDCIESLQTWARRQGEDPMPRFILAAVSLFISPSQLPGDRCDKYLTG